jgi:exopolysaccharide biosynthesis predicted pyruvyltransferase EpsI
MFEELDKFLLELSGKGRIWYRPNPGNAGDSLIASATWARFSKLGLRVSEIPHGGFDASGRIVLYGGGGNLNPRYGEASEFIRAFHGSAETFVLLPHSVEGREDLLAELGPNVALFCREETTLRHCQRHAPRARTILSHDLALGNDSENQTLPSRRTWTKLAVLAGWNKLLRRGDKGPLPRALVRIAKFLRGHPAFRPRQPARRAAPELDAFRSDEESLGARLPEGNLDLSALLSLRSDLRIAHEASAALLVGSLRGYRKVRTDRLHVCIAAATLGLEVEFHPASGFKCEAIWTHSIRGRFPNVRWIGRP